MTTNELTTVLDGVLRNQTEKSFGSNEAIAAIAAVIALAALIVAGLARQDSKRSADAAQRSTELMASQLEILASAQTRQVQKELAENRPHFFWVYAAGGGISYDYNFINQGGIISKVVITNDAGIKSEIYPKDVIAPEQRGSIKFSWQGQNRPAKVNFTVEFSDKLDVRQKSNFTINSHPYGDWKMPELV